MDTMDSVPAAGRTRSLQRKTSNTSNERYVRGQMGTGFYSHAKYKIPGYTGFIPSLQETVAKTPIHAQDKTFKPEDNTFLQERLAPPEPQPQHDAFNDPDIFKKGLPKGQAVNLWPNKQAPPKPYCKADATAADRPASTRPQAIHIVHGDRRIRLKRTDYQHDYQPPSRPNSARALDPVTHRVVSEGTSEDIKAMYTQCKQRVGDSRRKMMIDNMKLRLETKIDVSTNANAFKLHRLFKMYDTHQTGMVDMADFRLTMQSFGIQLSEDELVVVFSKYDESCMGMICYDEAMADLLDSDFYKFYTSGVNR